MSTCGISGYERFPKRLFCSTTPWWFSVATIHFTKKDVCFLAEWPHAGYHGFICSNAFYSLCIEQTSRAYSHSQPLSIWEQAALVLWFAQLRCCSNPPILYPLRETVPSVGTANLLLMMVFWPLWFGWSEDFLKIPPFGSPAASYCHPLGMQTTFIACDVP